MSLDDASMVAHGDMASNERNHDMTANHIYCKNVTLLIMAGALLLIQGSELSASEVSWPLKISGNKRYLTQSNGTAFFYLCDTAWRLFDSTTFDEAKLYMNDRSKKGFSVIHAPLLVEPGPKASSDLTDPNDAYFDSCLAYVEYARSKGLAVNIIPAWMGYNGRAWGKTFKLLTKDQVVSFGAYVGRKFKHCDNVVYSMGGDMSPKNDENAISIADWMAEGLEQADPAKLKMYFCGGGQRSSKWFHNRAWCDFNFIEEKPLNSIKVYTQIITDYNLSPVKPTHLGEYAYEYEFTGQRWPQTGAYYIRRSAYWSILSGGMGYTYGRRGLWQFNSPNDYDYKLHSPWQDLLNVSLSPGSFAMTHMVTLLKTHAWEKLIPSHANRFATAGFNQGGLEFTASAVASDGSYALAYFPVQKTTTFNLTRLRGNQVKARWFDPHNGAYTLISGSPFSKDIHSFTTPGKNSDGKEDWVLVLEMQ